MIFEPIKMSELEAKHAEYHKHLQYVIGLRKTLLNERAAISVGSSAQDILKLKAGVQELKKANDTTEKLLLEVRTLDPKFAAILDEFNHMMNN